MKGLHLDFLLQDNLQNNDDNKCRERGLLLSKVSIQGQDVKWQLKQGVND